MKKKPKAKKISLKIGIVVSRFNEEVTQKLEQGAIDYLETVEDFDLDLQVIRVPGAVEIPLAAQMMLDKKVDGIVTLGAVIRGETSHYDSVCRCVETGVMQLMLQYKKPIGFGVLMTENEEQAFDRTGGVHGHKGAEAAQVVIEMIQLKRSLSIK